MPSIWYGAAMPASKPLRMPNVAARYRLEWHCWRAIRLLCIRIGKRSMDVHLWILTHFKLTCWSQSCRFRHTPSPNSNSVAQPEMDYLKTQYNVRKMTKALSKILNSLIATYVHKSIFKQRHSSGQPRPLHLRWAPGSIFALNIPTSNNSLSSSRKIDQLYGS